MKAVPELKEQLTGEEGKFSPAGEKRKRGAERGGKRLAGGQSRVLEGLTSLVKEALWTQLVGPWGITEVFYIRESDDQAWVLESCYSRCGPRTSSLATTRNMLERQTL